MNSNTTYDTPINILITGVSGGSIGEQVFKTLHTGELNYRILVTNTNLQSLAVVKADYYEILPPANAINYIDDLIRIINQYKIHFLIPGSEPELIKISQNKDCFTQTQVKLLVNTPEIIATCVDKNLTFRFLQDHHFSVPQTIFLNRLEELNDTKIALPCILKPARGGGGSALTFLAQDQDELAFFAHYLIKYGCQPLIQEYIPSAESEYTIGVLNSPDQHLIGTVVLHRQILTGLSNRLKIKNSTNRTELGPVLAVSSGISQGRIVEFDPIRQQAENIANTLGSTGPLNIQGRWNGKEFIPFEINPRFSGTTPMRAMAGFNEPELLIKWHLGILPKDKIFKAQPGEFTRGLVEFFTQQ